MTIIHKPNLIAAVLASALTIASVHAQQQATDVPEFLPGLLSGYSPKEVLPNSLALLPTPPAAGSLAPALDEEVDRRRHRGATAREARILR